MTTMRYNRPLAAEDAGGAGWNLTRAGKEVAVVERQWVCGSRPAGGCVSRLTP
jgi:hypothetical protein